MGPQQRQHPSPVLKKRGEEQEWCMVVVCEQGTGLLLSAGDCPGAELSLEKALLELLCPLKLNAKKGLWVAC